MNRGQGKRGSNDYRDDQPQSGAGEMTRPISQLDPGRQGSFRPAASPGFGHHIAVALPVGVRLARTQNLPPSTT
ncbi:MAG: hypothetical protein ACRDRX_05780 [Pseudonocardiaceae bacterium]